MPTPGVLGGEMAEKTLEIDLLHVASALEGLSRRLAQSAEDHDSTELSSVACTIAILNEKLLDLSEVAAGMQHALKKAA